MYVGIVFERISGWVGLDWGGRGGEVRHAIFLSIFELRDRFEYWFLPFHDGFFLSFPLSSLLLEVSVSDVIFL